MAKPNPEDRTDLDQVLRLVNQLTPEEQEQLVEEIKLQWLRRELGKGEESLARGDVVPGEVVLAELKQRAEERLRKSQS